MSPLSTSTPCPGLIARAAGRHGDAARRTGTSGAGQQLPASPARVLVVAPLVCAAAKAEAAPLDARRPSRRAGASSRVSTILGSLRCLRFGGDRLPVKALLAAGQPQSSCTTTCCTFAQQHEAPGGEQPAVGGLVRRRDGHVQACRRAGDTLPATVMPPPPPMPCPPPPPPHAPPPAHHHHHRHHSQPPPPPPPTMPPIPGPAREPT